MTLQNNFDSSFSNNADGWSLGAGTTLRTLTLSGADLPINLSSVGSGNLLQYNGTNWVNATSGSAPVSYSTVISSWTLVSGNLYAATVTHNLNTQNVCVSLYDTSNNTVIFPDSIILTSANTARIIVTSNTHTINATFIANGLSVAPSANVVTIQNQGTSIGGVYNTINILGSTLNAVNAGAGTAYIISTAAPVTYQSKYYYAASFENPNSSDWAVNSLAPATNDATNSSLIIRSFVNGTETGVGFYGTIPTGATNITFAVKGRAATAPGSASTVILKLYSRAIPNNAAIGTWSAGNNIGTLSIPTNAYYQYSNLTVPLSTLGLTAGSYYEFELTRIATDSLSSAYNLSEFIVGNT